MRFLLSIVSFFNLVNPFVNYQVVSTYTDIYFSEAEYKITYDYNYDIYYQDNYITNISGNNKIVPFVEESKLVIFYSYSTDIYVSVYDRGQLIKEKKLSNPFSKNFFVFKTVDGYVLASTIEYYVDQLIEESKKEYLQYRNAFIGYLNNDFEFTSSLIFGGVLDENVLGMVCLNNNYYIVGKKATLTGYDLGNGGNESYGYYLALVDASLKLVDYKVFSDEEMRSLEILNDKIILFTNTNVYLFDSYLNLKMSQKLPTQSVFGTISINYKVVIFDYDMLTIYDLFSREIEYQQEFFIDDASDFNFYIANNKINIMEDGTIKEIDIYDIRSFNREVIYNSDCKSNINIAGLYKIYPLEQQDIAPSFNPTINGIYTVTYYYDNKRLELFGTISVLEEENVSEKKVYPLGYKLNFTGIGYLNEKLIVNNYSLDQEGYYVLELYNNFGEKRQISFYVRRDQVKYKENMSKTWDYTINLHQTLTIDYEIENKENIEDIKLIINNEEYTNFSIEENFLHIYFNESIPGIYFYQIEKLTYYQNDIYRQYYLHKPITINVITDSLEKEVEISDDLDNLYYNCQLDDLYNLVRGFRLRINGEKEIINDYYITSTSLNLYNLLPNNYYDVSVYILVDYGLKQYNEELLFETTIYPKKQTLNLGEINIIQKGERLEKFQIGILKDQEITSLSVNDKVIYNFSENKHQTSLVIIIIICALIMIIGIILLVIKKIKTKKIQL